MFKILSILLLFCFFKSRVSLANWHSIDSPSFITSGHESIIGQLGDYGQFVPLAIALGFVAYYEDTNIFKNGTSNFSNNFTKENYKNDGLFQLSTVTSASLLSSIAIKSAVGRDRPNDYEEGEHTARFNSSFPSGHTTMAFAPSFFIAQRYGWWKAAPALVISSMVGYSRVAVEAHYITDILGAVAMTYLYSHFLTFEYKIGDAHISLGRPPVGSQFGAGIQVAWN